MFRVNRTVPFELSSTSFWKYIEIRMKSLRDLCRKCFIDSTVRVDHMYEKLQETNFFTSLDWVLLCRINPTQLTRIESPHFKMEASLNRVSRYISNCLFLQTQTYTYNIWGVRKKPNIKWKIHFNITKPNQIFNILSCTVTRDILFVTFWFGGAPWHFCNVIIWK